MLDFRRIPREGVKLYDLMQKTISSLEEDEFLEACPYPFLMQVPMTGGQPGTGSEKATASYAKSAPVDMTVKISYSELRKMQRSKHVENTMIHIVCPRGETDRVDIGRSKECDVVLNDATVSKQHAEMYSALGQWMIVDKGSHNGTLRGQEKLVPGEPTPLQGGESLRFTAYHAMFLLPEQVYELSQRMKKG